MRLLLSYLRRHSLSVASTLVLALVGQALVMVDPIILRHLIDTYALHYSEHSPVEFVTRVGGWLGVGISIALLSRLAKGFQDYCLNTVTQRVGAQIYTDGIKHLLDLPYSVFEQLRSGETLGIVEKARTDAQRFISVVVNTAFSSLAGLAFAMVYAYTVHWTLAPVYFATMPLLAWLGAVLSRRLKQLSAFVAARKAELAGSTTESLRNIELIKGLGLGQQEIERLSGAAEKILALELSKVRRSRITTFLHGLIVNSMRTSVLFALLYLTYRQHITLGQLLSLLMCSTLLFGPLQEIGTLMNVHREAEASLEMYGDLRRLRVESNVSPVQRFSTLHALRFEGVGFQHQSAESPAIVDVSFTVRQGETIAFVGPSGAGKSTLIKLIVGLYKPQRGRILYNDVSADQLDIQELQRAIGLVTQDPQLFSGTIRENLLFANAQASETDCVEALHKAACDRLLARAGGGLDAVIGESGLKLSGGERQRLSIARALLRRPQLLVFDEATSSLDSLTEQGVVDTIRDVSRQQGIVTIAVAHRLSTVMHADRIFVLERGRVIEMGCHDELIALNGMYHAMWRQQVGERPARDDGRPAKHELHRTDSGAGRVRGSRAALRIGAPAGQFAR
jgi:ATP-binding cassette subfamily B protein